MKNIENNISQGYTQEKVLEDEMSENIINKIEDLIPTLSIKQKKVALAILQDPLAASFLSVKALSEKINVSPATIVRFAQDITGDGFPKLQQELHKYVQTESNPIKRMKLNVNVNSKDEELLARFYQTQIENLQTTFSSDLIRRMNQAYEIIKNAKRLFSLGTRGSFSVSYFLGQHLNRAFGNVGVVPDDDKLADFLCSTKENDAAIFVCVARYSTRLYTTAKLLKEKNVKIITINDSLDSPFVPLSDVAFLAPCSSNDFHNSVMAPMLVAELLISLVITKGNEEAINSLNKYERYFEELGQFCIKDK